MGYLNDNGIIKLSLLMKRANSIARQNYRIDKKVSHDLKININKSYHDYLKVALVDEWVNVKEAICVWNNSGRTKIYKDSGSVLVTDDYVTSVSTDGKIFQKGP